MGNKLQYSSSLNGASFLLFELKQVIKLKLKGLSNKEIRQKVVEENLFQFNNKGRITRALPSLLKRSDSLDDFLGQLLIEAPVEIGKIINLYSIMKTDLLFFEFMNEVVSEKMKSNNLIIEKKDINVFFTEKAEQSERVASWSEINIQKLKRAYMQVLFESGMLKDRKTLELRYLPFDDQLKRHLIRIGDTQYLQAMGENEGL